MRKLTVFVASLSLIAAVAVAGGLIAPRRAGAQVPSAKSLSGGAYNGPVTGLSLACGDQGYAGASATTLGCALTVSSAKGSCTLLFHDAPTASAAFATIRDSSGQTQSTVLCEIDGVVNAPNVTIDTTSFTTPAYPGRAVRFHY